MEAMRIANNVQLQQQLDNTQKKLRAVKSQVKNTSTEIMQALEANKENENNNGTTFESMKAKIAKQAKELKDLKNRLIQNDGNVQPPPTTEGRKIWRPKSDGDPSKGPKTKKFYKNNNCCSTHGYDVSNNHNSGNCNRPGPSHNSEHTSENPKPGASQKDKEFSKWAGKPAS